MGYLRSGIFPRALFRRILNEANVVFEKEYGYILLIKINLELKDMMSG